MKNIKLLLFVGAVCIAMISNGQVPQLIDYQGMARDGSGSPITNTTISARISVYEGPLPGILLYSELHNPSTDSYGLFHFMIGGGTVLFGDFNTIPWGWGDFFIKTEIDPAGGTAFVDMGMSKMTTVPFAFYAASAGGGGSTPWITNGNDIYYDNGYVGIGTSAPSNDLHIENTGGAANAYINSTQSYYIANATGNTGLWFQESHVDVAFLYWNPASQAIFMYENGTQTMTWKGNNVGIGTIDPLVNLQVTESGSAGALGSDLGIMYSATQMLAPAILGWSENNTADITQGVLGHAYSTSSSFNEGVFAEGGGGSVNNYGVYAVGMGDAGSGYSIAVYGDDDGTATNNFAGYFIGDVEVVGNLAKSGGSFKIDHPQDPANKFLVHSFVESPDMMNIYNGNATTGADGYAKVELPSYFDALNIDFRYQLTVIGEFAQAIVKEEISGNHFTIQTDKPNVKVSWQVTGVRNDVWAQENRIEAEVNKNNLEKGRYLHPELHGKSMEMGMKAGIPSQDRAAYKAAAVKEKDERLEPNQK